MPTWNMTLCRVIATIKTTLKSITTNNVSHKKVYLPKTIKLHVGPHPVPIVKIEIDTK